MNKIDKQFEHYKLLYNLVLHESNAVWNTGQLFLIANTFLAAIIGTNFPNFSNTPDWNKELIFWLLSLLGFLISVLWFFSFNRTKKYYHFRMAEAKEKEKELQDINIFSGSAENLAYGGVIKSNKEKYDLKVFFRLLNLSSLKIVNIVIIIFIIFYFFICIYFFPWKLLNR